jgi:hypothetical protein
MITSEEEEEDTKGTHFITKAKKIISRVEITNTKDTKTFQKTSQDLPRKSAHQQTRFSKPQMNLNLKEPQKVHIRIKNPKKLGEKKEEGEFEGVETDSRKDSKTEERKSDPFGGITPRDEDTFKKEKSELELKKEESADLASEEVSIKYVKFEGNKTHEIPASFNTQIPKETANPQTEQIRIIQKDLPNQKNTNIQEEESKGETETKYFKGRGKNVIFYYLYLFHFFIYIF